MRTDTPARAWTAMALGAFFATATAYVLIEDVIQGAPFTSEHLGSIAALVAAIAAGCHVWPALRRGAISTALTLAIVHVGATAYVVIGAGMRNAERAAGKAELARTSIQERGAAEADWRRLADELAALGQPRSTQAVRAAMDAIVGPGEGRVPLRVFSATRQCTDITREGSAAACQPLLALRVEMASAIRKHELEPRVAAARSKLDAMPVSAAAGTGHAHAARIIAALPLVTVPVDEIRERLSLLLPFLRVVIGELAAAGFLHLAIAARRRTVRTVRHAAARVKRSAPVATVRPDRPAMAPDLTGPSAPRQVSAGRSGPDKGQCLAELVTMLALGQSVPSQRALADRWSRPKQTVSDWLREWEATGLIPPRRTVGREKAILSSA